MFVAAEEHKQDVIAEVAVVAEAEDTVAGIDLDSEIDSGSEEAEVAADNILLVDFEEVQLDILVMMNNYFCLVAVVQVTVVVVVVVEAAVAVETKEDCKSDTFVLVVIVISLINTPDGKTARNFTKCRHLNLLIHFKHGKSISVNFHFLDNGNEHRFFGSMGSYRESCPSESMI